MDYKNCKCKNKLVDKLVEEYIENIDGNKMLHIETLDAIPLSDYKKVCNSCTIYIVLFAVFFITSICNSSVLLAVYAIAVLSIFIVILKKIMLVLSLILVLKQQFIKHINGKYQTN